MTRGIDLNMQNIEKDILLKAQMGDIDAFEEIYKISSGYVYTIILKVVGNKEDAEEVTQDVFISVYKNLKRFGFRSSFKTWLYRIAVNRAINMFNKRKKERPRKVLFDENIDYAREENDTKTDIDKKHDEKVLEAILEELPPDQKACLVLKEIEGMKYEEIAQTLNINLNTVRSRLKRAREKLISSVRGREAIQ